MPNDNMTRWTVTVSKETDLALRSFLGSRGMRKGDLSKFIEDAVLCSMVQKSESKTREGLADLSAGEVQATVKEAATSAPNVDR